MLPLSDDWCRTCPLLLLKPWLNEGGAVIVDVSIDTGGFETSEVTSHEKPTFIKIM
jgi:alanine dehydrogenase